MSELHEKSEEYLHLYDTYRGITAGSYPHAAGVINSLQMFANKKFYDTENADTITIENLEDGSYKCHWGIPGYDDFVIPLYREGIALARVFGSFVAEDKMGPDLAAELEKHGVKIDEPLVKSWKDIFKTKSKAEEEFDKISGKSYIYAAFEIVRLQSLLKLLHDNGDISEQNFLSALASINKRMDRIGLNGIDKMIEVRPELMDIIANDPRKIPMDYEHRKDIPTPYSETDVPDFVKEIFANQEMSRGRYFTLINENICKTPSDKQKLVKLMMGKDYLEAFEDRIHKFTAHEQEAYKASLNIPLSKLNEIFLDQTSCTDEQDNALRTFLLNYGLGSSHEKLQDIAAKFKNTSSASIIDKQITALSENASQHKSSSADSSDNEESTKQKTSTGKNYKNFVTAGKIATTAVLGIGVIDGVRNLIKKEENPDKPKSNSKIFIHAIEAAAAIAGIILLWKSKKVHNFLNNLFKAGAQSV